MSTEDTHVRPQLAAGTVLSGRFELLRPLGAGGMGTVWAARDPSGREVAVKVLREVSQANARGAERMSREARVLARLAHPNIVAVLSAETDPSLGLVFIAQPLLKGEDLRAKLKREGRLSVEDALDVIEPLADALACAHAAGVVHRDIKPENLFLARDEDGGVSPTLIDFGIAFADEPAVPTLTSAGTVLGTPHYMSPEQLRGDRSLDGRTDLWSLGVVLYECLSGRRPFEAASASAVIAKIVTEDPAPIDGLDERSPAVAALLRRALARDCDARFATAEALRDAVRAAREGRVCEPRDREAPGETRAIESPESKNGGWFDALSEHATAAIARPVAPVVEATRAAQVTEPPAALAEPAELAGPASSRAPAPTAPASARATVRVSIVLLALVAAVAVTTAVVASLREERATPRDASRVSAPTLAPPSSAPREERSTDADAAAVAVLVSSADAATAARGDETHDARGPRNRAANSAESVRAGRPTAPDAREDREPSPGARELRRRFRNGAPVLPP